MHINFSSMADRIEKMQDSVRMFLSEHIDIYIIWMVGRIIFTVTDHIRLMTPRHGKYVT